MGEKVRNWPRHYPEQSGEMHEPKPAPTAGRTLRPNCSSVVQTHVWALEELGGESVGAVAGLCVERSQKALWEQGQQQGR